MVALVFFLSLSVLQTTGTPKLERPEFTTIQINQQDFGVRYYQKRSIPILRGVGRLSTDWLRDSLEISDIQGKELDEFVKAIKTHSRKLTRSARMGTIDGNFDEIRKSYFEKLRNIVDAEQLKKWNQFNWQLDMRCNGLSYFFDKTANSCGLEIRLNELETLRDTLDKWHETRSQEISKWVDSKIDDILRTNLEPSEIRLLEKNGIEFPIQNAMSIEVKLAQLRLIEDPKLQSTTGFERYCESPWFMIDQSGRWNYKPSHSDESSARLGILKFVTKPGNNERFELFLSDDEIREINRFIRQFVARRNSATETYSKRDRSDKSGDALAVLRESRINRERDLKEGFESYLFAERSAAFRDLYLEKETLARFGSIAEILNGNLATKVEITKECEVTIREEARDLADQLVEKIRVAERDAFQLLSNSIPKRLSETYTQLVGEQILDHPYPSILYFSKKQP